MAGLKELRTHIGSIKSTQKITSAMKMIAATRLRKAQALVEKSQAYTHDLLMPAIRLLSELRYQEKNGGQPIVYPKLVSGNGNNKKYILIVFTSDRGLCGGYNSNIAKEAALRIEELKKEGKEIKILCVGKKGKDILKRKYSELILETQEGIAAKGANYAEAAIIADKLMEAFFQGQFDICEFIVSRFRSAISRDIKVIQTLPIMFGDIADERDIHIGNISNDAYYDYEPDALTFFSALLPLIFRNGVFQAIVNAQASEHGARMTSMDNATRNANDIISKLSIKYNGLRQSAITTELTEIISGAEAL